MHPADIVASVFAVLANIGILIYFFTVAEYTGVFQFQRVIAPATGEPVSVVLSLVYYAFLGSIAWLVLGIGLGVGVSWPVSMVYAVVSKGSKRRWDDIPGFAGIGVSAMFSPVVLLVCGFLIMFGVFSV